MASRSQALLAIVLCFGAGGALKAADAIQDFTAAQQRAQAMAEQSRARSVAKPMANSALAGIVSEAEAAGNPFVTGEIKKDAAQEAPEEPKDTSPHAEENALIRALKKREQELVAYERQLDARKLELEAAAKKIEERIAQLESSKKEFEKMVELVDGAAQRDIAHLVQMYTKMKPQQAAEIFNSMPPNFASGFLAQMKSNAASQILANMETKKAYAVTLELAGRNVTAPKR
ncbi:MAG: hypothetical protein MRY63_07920 [Neomegalonema sp.]|nr:hypothetical protein [Neomegalonema sp.]